MAKNPGKIFEESFIKSVPERCDVTRLKDAGGWSNATNTRFTSKNPCDFIVYSDSSVFGYPRMFKLELKSLLKKSLPYANIKPKTKKLTAEENAYLFVCNLVESENKGVCAMFVVNFRDVNETYTVFASDVKRFMETETRQSIPLAWFRENGELVEQTLIRVRYRYDLEWL